MKNIHKAQQKIEAIILNKQIHGISGGETIAVYKSNIFEIVRHLGKYDSPEESDLLDLEERQQNMGNGIRSIR